MNGNTSGLTPVEFKVLVKPDDVEMRTTGGLYIPETLRDKERMAQVKATLIQCGGNAFEDWKDPVPCPGARVYVAKYAGLRLKGKDEEWYQLVNDKDICALIED